MLVSHPKTRFISFTGSRDVGLHINELAAKTPRVRSGSSASSPKWVAKTPSSSTAKSNLDQAVFGVLYSAFGYQGQKCSACSRAIVDEVVYDEFLEKLKTKAERLTIGPSDQIENYMGPVISAARSRNDSKIY